MRIVWSQQQFSAKTVSTTTADSALQYDTNTPSVGATFWKSFRHALHLVTAHLHRQNQVAHALRTRDFWLASLSIHFPIHFARRAHKYPVTLTVITVFILPRVVLVDFLDSRCLGTCVTNVVHHWSWCACLPLRQELVSWIAAVIERIRSRTIGSQNVLIQGSSSVRNGSTGHNSGMAMTSSGIRIRAKFKIQERKNKQPPCCIQVQPTFQVHWWPTLLTGWPLVRFSLSIVWSWFKASI